MSENHKVVIFCAPSGSGKTTIVKHLLSVDNRLSFSVSACTRPQRANEVYGKDYYFLSLDEFKQKIIANEFLEYEEVYGGNFYGTLKSEVDRIWLQNKVVIFDVDIKALTKKDVKPLYKARYWDAIHGNFGIFLGKKEKGLNIFIFFSIVKNDKKII